jgi:DNA-binding NarL/FixJ family response regulator
LQTHLKAQDSLAKLTPRQRDVLPLLAQGMSNKEIARALKIAEATTKIHAAALCRVLGVRNRTEAAVAARQLLQTKRESHPSHRA